MNDEQFFLANAYVDGELTGDERRTAHADPEVMAEVERLRAVRAELRAVPPATDDAREAAIAAAMSEFRATTPDVAPEPTEPRVVPYRPRPAYARYLAVAAALVAVAGLGIVISQVGGGNDDDAAPASAEESGIAEQSALEEVLSTVVEDPTAMAEADATARLGAEDGGAQDDMDEATAETRFEEEAEAAAEEAAPPVDAGAAPEFETDAAVSLIPVPPGFDPGQPITDEVELAVYGAFLIEQRDLRQLPPTPETRCGSGDDVVLDRAVYIGDGDVRPVYIAVNEIDGLVLALDPQTCEVIAEGDLF